MQVPVATTDLCHLTFLLFQILMRIHSLLPLAGIWASKEDAILCLVAQSCLTLCDLMDCSLPGFSVHGNSSGKNTGVGCHYPLQVIFPTQGSNLGLLHCRQNIYSLKSICLKKMWTKIFWRRAGTEVQLSSNVNFGFDF